VPELLRIVHVPEDGEAALFEAGEVVVVDDGVEGEAGGLPVVGLAVEHLDAVTAHCGDSVDLLGEGVGQPVVDVPRDGGVVNAGEQVDSVGVLGLCVDALRVGVGAAGEAADEDACLVDSSGPEAVEHGVDGVEVFAAEMSMAIGDGNAGELAELHRNLLGGAVCPSPMGCIRPGSRSLLG
jgi:hypothetical protein